MTHTHSWRGPTPAMMEDGDERMVCRCGDRTLRASSNGSGPYPGIGSPRDESAAVAFSVRGLPVPQGSKVPGVTKEGKPYLRDVKPKALADWRNAIAVAASDVMATDPLLDDAVRVRAEFILPRGKSVKRRHPAVRPDLDKLTRALLDACTGVVYRDDALVVYLSISKAYGDAPGVHVTIEEVK